MNTHLKAHTWEQQLHKAERSSETESLAPISLILPVEALKALKHAEERVFLSKLYICLSVLPECWWRASFVCEEVQGTEPRQRWMGRESCASGLNITCRPSPAPPKKPSPLRLPYPFTYSIHFFCFPCPPSPFAQQLSCKRARPRKTIAADMKKNELLSQFYSLFFVGNTPGTQNK